MTNKEWTYVGRADFGADPGVSLTGLTFNEVLAIATVTDFPIYAYNGSTSTPLVSSTSLSFFWIPNLGEIQLSQSVEHADSQHNHLLVTMLFKKSAVRTYSVIMVDRSSGTPWGYNTPEHGYIKVYCR